MGSPPEPSWSESVVLRHGRLAGADPGWAAPDSAGLQRPAARGRIRDQVVAEY